MMGWECPRCHAVYAPHISACSSCTGFKVTVQQTGTGVFEPCRHEFMGPMLTGGRKCRKCGQPEFVTGLPEITA